MEFVKEKNICIRKFKYSDLFDVVNIEYSVFKEYEHFGLYDFHFYHKYYPSCFLVAQNLKTKKIIGYVIFTPYGHIISIAVDRKYQHTGVGRRLLLKAFSISRRVWLEVDEHNKKAINFYKHLGFRERKIVQNYYKEGENAIIMEKILNKF
ncbi:MAG: N-acetyltransferase [Candidatus Altiarchaeota archaeon]